jgi:hypothetical protein
MDFPDHVIAAHTEIELPQDYRMSIPHQGILFLRSTPAINPADADFVRMFHPVV